MNAHEFDCIVVGGGPGGYVAAIRAAQLGMKTAVIERDGSLGGRCLNYACIPAKVVLRSADVLEQVQSASEFGVDFGGDQVGIRFAAVAQRRARVITGLTRGVAGLLRKNLVEVITGEATLGQECDLHVGNDRYEARAALVLATGSVRQALPQFPFGGRVIGTEEAWALDELPESLVVVGAGSSGAEIASAYARFGTHVTLYEASHRVLPGEDADISAVALSAFKKQGIEVKTSTAYTGEDADWIVVATGRRPDTAALALDRAGVQLDARGFVEVDDRMRTSSSGVYAIGDIVAGPALAHKASEEAVIAVEDAAGLATNPLHPTNVPRATFCAPNVGSVGLTEDEARRQGHDVVIGSVQYGAVGAASVYGDRTGLIKIVGERKYGELLGAHIIGPRATDLIQQLVDVKLLEAGYAEIARMVHGHPTFSELILEAARAADGWVIHG